MYRGILISIILILSSSQTLFSNNLLFYIDDKDMKVPYTFEIERILNNLVSAKKVNEPLLKEVTSLNEVYENQIDILGFRTLIEIIVPSELEDNKKYEELQKVFVRKLLQHDYFLKVKVAMINNKVEYNFSLYETTKQEGTMTFNDLTKEIKKRTPKSPF